MTRLFRSVSTYIALAIGLAGLALVLYAWRLPPFTSSVETTENAAARARHRHPEQHRPVPDGARPGPRLAGGDERRRRRGAAGCADRDREPAIARGRRRGGGGCGPSRRDRPAEHPHHRPAGRPAR